MKPFGNLLKLQVRGKAKMTAVNLNYYSSNSILFLIHKQFLQAIFSVETTSLQNFKMI